MTVRIAVIQEKQTILLLLEYQYRNNSRFRVIEFLWKVPKKKCANKQVKRNDNSITKTLQFTQTCITRNCFTRYCTWSLLFNFMLSLPRFEKNYFDGD